MFITGSPFQFTVGPLNDFGAHRVHAGGPGLERGEVNQPGELSLFFRREGLQILMYCSNLILLFSFS